MRDVETVVTLRCGVKPSGEVARENLLVRPLPRDRFELLKSPGFVLGLAAGDVIELRPGREPDFELISRGDNVVIHVFSEARALDDAQLEPLKAEISRLGGSYDGGVERELAIFTLPVGIGFEQIESPFKNFVADDPALLSWYFGNVYEEDGVTPLDWWR